MKIKQKQRKPGSGGSRPGSGRKASEPTENYTIKISINAKTFYKTNAKGLARQVLEAHFNAVQADA